MCPTVPLGSGLASKSDLNHENLLPSHTWRWKSASRDFWFLISEDQPKLWMWMHHCVWWMQWNWPWLSFTSHFTIIYPRAAAVDRLTGAFLLVSMVSTEPVLFRCLETFVVFSFRFLSCIQTQAGFHRTTTTSTIWPLLSELRFGIRKLVQSLPGRHLILMEVWAVMDSQRAD